MTNHAGGYSWRLCRHGDHDVVSETCFQRTVLRFAGNHSYIRFADQLQWAPAGSSGRAPYIPQVPDIAVPRVTVTEGTTPPGSEWARVPVPVCELCGPTAHAACAAEDTKNDDYHCTMVRPPPSSLTFGPCLRISATVFSNFRSPTPPPHTLQ